MVQNKQVTPWHFGSFPETLSGWKSILHEKAHIPDGGNTRGLFPSVDRAQMTGLLCAVQGRDRRDRLGVMVRAFFTRATSGQGVCSLGLIHQVTTQRTAVSCYFLGKHKSGSIFL